MDPMRIYQAVRSVPQEAQKPIQAGRLKGKTDINPMWRLRVLTETFGPCGIGWKYEITNKDLRAGGDGEIAAFVDVALYYRDGDQWSEPIPGTGGSMFVSKERNGNYTSDECFKMALTDAISVACKALGVGADIYWNSDPTKYNKPEPVLPPCTDCGGQLAPIRLKDGRVMAPADVHTYSTNKYGVCLCQNCMTARDRAQRGEEHAE